MAMAVVLPAFHLPSLLWEKCHRVLPMLIMWGWDVEEVYLVKPRQYQNFLQWLWICSEGHGDSDGLLNSAGVVKGCETVNMDSTGQ